MSETKEATRIMLRETMDLLFYKIFPILVV